MVHTKSYPEFPFGIFVSHLAKPLRLVTGKGLTFRQKKKTKKPAKLQFKVKWNNNSRGTPLSLYGTERNFVIIYKIHWFPFSRHQKAIMGNQEKSHFLWWETSKRLLIIRWVC